MNHKLHFNVNQNILCVFVLPLFILFSCKKTSNQVESITAANVCLLQSEYVNYTVNGNAYSYVSPVDSIFQGGQGEQGQLGSYYSNFPVVAKNNTISPNNSVSLGISNINSSQGSVQNLRRFICPQFKYGALLNPVIIVNLTEYSNSIGGYISGNFSGILNGMNDDGTLTGLNYTVDCCFRVKRAF